LGVGPDWIAAREVEDDDGETVEERRDGRGEDTSVSNAFRASFSCEFIIPSYHLVSAIHFCTSSAVMGSLFPNFTVTAEMQLISIAISICSSGGEFLPDLPIAPSMFSNSEMRSPIRVSAREVEDGDDETVEERRDGREEDTSVSNAFRAPFSREFIVPSYHSVLAIHFFTSSAVMSSLFPNFIVTSEMESRSTVISICFSGGEYWHDFPIKMSMLSNSEMSLSILAELWKEFAEA
jgi:hypothetical protein